MKQDQRLVRVIELYRTLDKDKLHLLAEVYADGILFEDPAHRIQGRMALERYFSALYKELDSIHFEIESATMADQYAWLSWTMILSHPRLASGKSVTVSGASRLNFDEHGMVLHHRDYFDLGALLYEHLPLLGPVVRALKRRFGA
ncbi:nuclear transport factor 2 family protein [Shewanella cyperi]|uniref:nuclear transport factor 2 family protein n=1 Tax=Shewanella cyperi TaxID=2814292 RepID=UPI001A949864|nr:nuclear transport factor 2 family protein [Shewanella cyperi]QSX40283.1 nuclear transport factor 2 family protein [Shewanella cyperi]